MVRAPAPAMYVLKYKNEYTIYSVICVKKYKKKIILVTAMGKILILNKGEE